MGWMIAAVTFMAVTYAVLAATIWIERRRQRQHIDDTLDNVMRLADRTRR